MRMLRIITFFALFVVSAVSATYFGTQLKASDHCFCKLKGRIDDCSCNVDTVDHFNNMKIYPRISSLLHKNYFRFYKVNLNHACPFWSDDSRCAIRYCHVEPCLDEDIPEGLKGHPLKRTSLNEPPISRYSEAGQNTECNNDHNEELGYLNMTISAAAYEEFARWKAYDDAQDNFCVMNDDDSGAEYVDLLLNPERYTGYKGKSAHRIWHSIYMENCFRPKNSYSAYIESSRLNGMCLEKRVFYRAISGLHTSINIHLSSNYLLSEKSALGLDSPGGRWGPHLEEFKRRFDPETTNGEGPQWLRNLYFLYLLELRALAKAAPYLEREEYYTGNDQDDEEMRIAIKDILKVIRSFPDHFNESSMFNGGKPARKLKEEFRQHFRNISRIMDCVGCEKCKLWGKLQIHGLGTALKILFSGKFDDHNFVTHLARNRFQLQRSEIVALFNAFGSNRSLAFLKMQQFYYAMEDAKETIKLKPEWAKGYFRKAEVEFSTFHFSDALVSYGLALKLQPNDPSILEAMVKASQERQKDMKADDQIPWLGAGVGIIMGVVIVIADHILTHKPTLVHPILMALLTIAIAMVGYGIARGFRYYVKCQRQSLLEPPVDLFPEETKESASEEINEPMKEEKTHRSYTKAQARQRFKKGRS